MKKVLIFISILMSFFSISFIESGIQESHSDIAVYSDNGVDRNLVIAVEKMFEWMGYTYTEVDAGYLNRKGLKGFKILCIPGGDMFQYSRDLNKKGKRNIRKFVESGGGYIGICGGAYFACDKVIWRGRELDMISLGLLEGTGTGPLEDLYPYPEYGMAEIEIVDREHPISKDLAEQYDILYYWGPALLPSDEDGITVIGRYNNEKGDPAIVAFEYGSGRVFLSGTHPENEEDSRRDGITFLEGLEDNGSDWEIVQSAVQWLLKEK